MEGNLRIDERINLEGVFIDITGLTPPPTEDYSPDIIFSPAQGPQSIGNSSAGLKASYPNYISSRFYNFPLKQSHRLSLGSIGLFAPYIGELTLDPELTLQEALDGYLDTVGVSDRPTISTRGKGWLATYAVERDLDTSIVAAINPNSNIRLILGAHYMNRLNFQEVFQPCRPQLGMSQNYAQKFYRHHLSLLTF